MKLKDIYQLAIKMGMEADPRPKKEIETVLADRKKKHDKLEAKEKPYFDEDSLFNPYYDSRVLYANSMDADIKTILVGIDMEHCEIQLASQLNGKGYKIDMVLAHHPEGRALLGLGKDMHLQNNVMECCGVSINTAEKILAPRAAEITRAVHPINFIRAIDTARLLKMNYACFHTITDNLAYSFITRKICEKKKYRKVQDVVDALMELPEYQMGAKAGNPIMVNAGSPDSLAGRVMCTEFTGGTSGNEEIYEKLSAAGVGTLIVMHMDEKHRKEAEKHHLNVIVAGHMASDSLGVNLLLDAIEKKGVKIITCGMFRPGKK